MKSDWWLVRNKQKQQDQDAAAQWEAGGMVKHSIDNVQ